jgi:hypothetical protein
MDQEAVARHSNQWSNSNDATHLYVPIGEAESGSDGNEA